MVDFGVHADSDCIEHVEDIHLVLEHVITKELRDRMVTGAPELVLESPVPVGGQNQG
jgi:hypothetical protein